MEDLSEIKYVKLNMVHLMKGKREKNTKLLKEFFEKIDRRVKGMKGYAIMESGRSTGNYCRNLLGNEGTYGQVL